MGPFVFFRRYTIQGSIALVRAEGPLAAEQALSVPRRFQRRSARLVAEANAPPQPRSLSPPARRPLNLRRRYGRRTSPFLAMEFRPVGHEPFPGRRGDGWETETALAHAKVARRLLRRPPTRAEAWFNPRRPQTKNVMVARTAARKHPTRPRFSSLARHAVRPEPPDLRSNERPLAGRRSGQRRFYMAPSSSREALDGPRIQFRLGGHGVQALRRRCLGESPERNDGRSSMPSRNSTPPSRSPFASCPDCPRRSLARLERALFQVADGSFSSMDELIARARSSEGTSADPQRPRDRRSPQPPACRYNEALPRDNSRAAPRHGRGRSTVCRSAPRAGPARSSRAALLAWRPSCADQSTVVESPGGLRASRIAVGMATAFPLSHIHETVDRKCPAGYRRVVCRAERFRRPTDPERRGPSLSTRRPASEARPGYAPRGVR